MKEVKAFIQPHKLSEVAVALREIAGVTGISVTDIRGFGRGRAKKATTKIIENLVAYAPMIKVEVMCKDKLVDAVIVAIEKAAHRGLRGDGKIYVTDVITAVRIGTGERGEDAV